MSNFNINNINDYPPTIRHILTGHSAPPDVIKVQNGRLFSMDSSSCDQSLRIWDLEEGKRSIPSINIYIPHCQIYAVFK